MKRVLLLFLFLTILGISRAPGYGPHGLPAVSCDAQGGLSHSRRPRSDTRCHYSDTVNRSDSVCFAVFHLGWRWMLDCNYGMS